MPNDLRDWTSAAGAPQRGLATFTAPPNATTSNTPTISRGTHSVAVLLNSLTNVNSISVTGVQTGVVYAANLLTLTAFGTLFFVPVLSDFDNQVTVAVTMGIGAQTATVRIAEILDPEIVSIFQSNTLVVQGTGISAAVNTDPIDRAGRLLGLARIQDSAGATLSSDGNTNLRVTLANATQADWQAPLGNPGTSFPIVPIDLGLGLAVNGVQNLVPAVVGKTVRLFGYHIETDATSAVGIASLEDTGAGVLDKTPLTAIPLGTFVDFHGARIAAGLGVQIANRGTAATAALRGSLTFSQD